MAKETKFDRTTIKPGTTREEIRLQAILMSERLRGRKATDEELKRMDETLDEKFKS